MYLKNHTSEPFIHDDVRQGFILSFQNKPDIDLADLERFVNEQIAKDLSVSLVDIDHISIGDSVISCTGPRMHVTSTGKLKKFKIVDHFIEDIKTGRWLLVGVVGDNVQGKIGDLNRVVDM